MKLKVMAMLNARDETNERISIRVLKRCNLEGYILFNDPIPSVERRLSGQRHVFHFPARCVEAGDSILLYTRAPKSEEINWSEAKVDTVHFFFWGLPEPIWDDGAPVHLFEIADLQEAVSREQHAKSRMFKNSNEGAF